MNTQKPNWVRETYTSGSWEFDLLLNTKNNDLYNFDDENTVRSKCFKGIFLNILTSTARSVYSVGAAVFYLTKAAAQCKNLDKSRFSLISARNSFADIFRAIGYGARMEGVLIYGVFNPLRGRAMYGHLERAYNRQNEKADFRKKWYTARCFQPITNKNDTDWKSRVQDYLDKTTQFYQDKFTGKLNRKDVFLMTYGCKSYKQILSKKT